MFSLHSAHQVRELSYLVETLFISNCNLVTGNNDGEIIPLFVFDIQRTSNHGISFGLGSMETYNGMRGQPLLEFTNPVGKCCERGNNDEGTGYGHGAQMSHQRNDLFDKR